MWRMSDLPPTRATALASPLRQFMGWMLTMNCPRCRVLGTVKVETFINSRGGTFTVGEVVARCAAGDAAPHQTGCASPTA
jgi:hypothetical protein